MKRTLLSVLSLALLLCRPACGGEIHDAALRGDLEKVQALLKADPALVSSKDDSGRTPLHAAAVVGHKDVVDLLCQHGGHE
jgi:ankyrin repeat protein